MSSASDQPTPAAAISAEVPFKVYKPSDYVSPPRPPLPDSYFAPSSSELKAAQQALSQRTHALVDAPLQLKATREANATTRLNRYPTTTVRIRFSDRHMLERTFESKEKIKSVYAFVRNTLSEEAKPTKFILYQTPPIRDLKVSDPKVKDQTLAQLGLAPSSILQLRFLEDSMNSVNFVAPLAPEILERAEELPIPPQDSPVLDEPASKVAKTSTSSSSSTLGGKKTPKWFKMGKK